MTKRGVYRNKIIPLVIVNLVIMCIVGSLCMGYMVKTTLSFFKQECSSYNGTVDKIADIVSKEIQSQQSKLESYASLMGSYKKLDKQEILLFLNNTYEQHTFKYLGVANAEGKGYWISGNSLFLEKKWLNTFFIVKGQEMPEIYEGHIGEEDLIYGVPIYIGEQYKGVMLGVIDQNKIVQLLYKSTLGENIALYLLDIEKNVLGCSQKAIQELKYNEIKKNTLFKEPNQEMYIEVYNGEKELYSLQDTKVSHLKRFFMEWISVFEKSTSVWYEKSVSLNGIKDYSILISKSVVLSDEMKVFIKENLNIIGVLSLAFVFLLVLLNISQNVCNLRLIKVAYGDPITGQKNWYKFKEDAKKILSRRRQRKYAVVCLDIDKFRLLMDIYGHVQTENLLVVVAMYLKKALLKKELFARHIEDQFVLLITYEDKDLLRDRLIKLDKALQSKIILKNVHFSYGIYLIDNYKYSLNRMVTYASLAKDSVKEQRDYRIAFFDEGIRDRLHKESQIERDMEDALINKEFSVYLQPKYRADGTDIEGAEALARWISPTKGVISPGEFIPIFEKNAFINKLDEYMLEAVCELQREWLNKGEKLITISVNISRKHLNDPFLVESICAIVDRYSLPRACIELELTESAFFEDKKTLVETVNRLRELGFKVSMDDFGSGYSSLNSLKDLVFDTVKLDGEFFNDAHNPERSRIVIEDTIALAKHLGIKIVAEGIEEQEQALFLNEIGCDLIQGYYFAKPMPVQEFMKLMGYKVE